MNRKIKIGVLGCAAIAQRSVIPAIQSLTDSFELVAIASRSIEKATQFAQQFNCKAVGSYEELIASDEIEALYIPLPTGLHKQYINQALQSGKHVYAEKSIASNYADAVEMVENAKSNHLAIMEGFMFQYHSQHQIVFDLLQQGEIGEIRFFSSAFGFPPLQQGNFRYDDQLGGGALLDAAGYTVRAAHFVLGDTFKVKAAALYNDLALGTNIYGSAFMSNGSGVGASLSFGFDNFYQCKYELWGSKGKIIVDRAFTPAFNYSPQIIVEKQGDTRVIQAEPDNHFVKAMQEFYSVIHNGEAMVNHYNQILLQSDSLEQIKLMSKNNE